MTLRSNRIELPARLADGRIVTVRVGVPDDSYIPKRELDTVELELWENERAIAAVTTVLDADQTSEGLALAREVVAGLESGELEPTAAAIEPLADTLR